MFEKRKADEQVLAERREVKCDITGIQKASLESNTAESRHPKATGQALRCQTGPTVSFFVQNLVSRDFSPRSLGCYLWFFFYLSIFYLQAMEKCHRWSWSFICWKDWNLQNKMPVSLPWSETMPFIEWVLFSWVIPCSVVAS